MNIQDLHLNRKVMIISQGFGEYFGEIMWIHSINRDDENTIDKIKITLIDNKGITHEGFEPEDLEVKND